MEIKDVLELQRAQRQLLRGFREASIDKSLLTGEERKALLEQYQSELKNVEKAKEEAMRSFDEEIDYYKTLISNIHKEQKV